jgi:MazG family protein
MVKSAAKKTAIKDHPTPLGAPDLQAASAAFANFCRTVAALRDKQSGCPWDVQQNHKSLRRYMLEEAYEACEAMGYDNSKAICDELGDVLLQVVLNSQIAHDERTFNIADVIQGIDGKMRRRHPHVFGTEDQLQANGPDQIRSKWDEIKAQERAADQSTSLKNPIYSGFFATVKGVHPASLQALKIGKLAAKIRFDWNDAKEVFAQVKSEMEEVAAEICRSPRQADKLSEEIGDVYFSLAQLCRHLSLEPETLLLEANQKFLHRFAKLEEIASAGGTDISTASRDQLEDLWKRVKKSEK